MYRGDLWPSGFYPMQVSAAEGKSPVWRHTALGTLAPGTSASVGAKIVGWEWDTRDQNGLEPPGVETVASSPATGNILRQNGPDYETETVIGRDDPLRRTGRGVVVNTATNHWNRGLVPATQMFSDGPTTGETSSRSARRPRTSSADMHAAPATPGPVSSTTRRRPTPGR